MRQFTPSLLGLLVAILINSVAVGSATKDSLKITDFRIYRVKDSLKVAFLLNINMREADKCKHLILQPYIVGETRTAQLNPLVIKPQKRTNWYSIFKRKENLLFRDRDRGYSNLPYSGSVKLEDWMTKKSWLEIESISDKDFVVYMDRSKSIIDVKNSEEIKVPVGLIAAQVSKRDNENQVLNSTNTKREKFEVRSTPLLESNSVNSTLLTSSSVLNSAVNKPINTVSKHDYSKFPFILEYSKLSEEYYKYEYLSEYGLPLYYEFNDLGLNDYYKNNFVALTKLYEALRKILVKDRQKIKKVVIAGYSSPEGYTVINEDIAKRRGEVLKDRLCKVIGINPDIVEVVNGGENWSGLKSLVEKSSLKDKEDLLNIINYKIVLKEFNRVEDPINSDRERKMLDLNYSNSYQQIRAQYFPMIRIAYVLIFY